MSDMIKTVTDANFEQEVLNSSKPVLVDFWAEWCGPCRALAPVLDEIAANYQDSLSVVKVNIDDSPKAPADYGVMSIPTLILFKNGKRENVMRGLLNKSQLKAFIDSNI